MTVRRFSLKTKFSPRNSDVLGDLFTTAELHVLQIIKTLLYIKSVIRSITCPLCNELGENFTFMDDNAFIHPKLKKS